MADEEEAMELSGESGLVSNLHNFSFNVSWACHDRDPSPQQIVRRPLLSPSRFQVSTPISRDWKSLTLPRRISSQGPIEMERHSTVKVSQHTPSFRDEEKRRQSFSPMELDQPESSFDFERSNTKPRKRHSDFCISYDNKKPQKVVTPLRKISEYNNNSITEHSTPKLFKNQMNGGPDQLTIDNQNHVDKSSELEDSVFTPNATSAGDESYDVRKDRIRKKRKLMITDDKKTEKKSSHLIIALLVLVMAGIAGYFLFQAGSCSVFDIDIVKLKHKLEDNVFGQQVAVKAVIEKLETFEKMVKSGNSKRSLVLSFHGWTGVGKNFISRFIAEAFYNSKVTLFSIPWHFPHDASSMDESKRLTKKVKNWILGNITKCGVNVFIFDEMDKSHDYFIAGLEAAMDEVRSQETNLVDAAIKTPIVVVLLISNSNAVQINQYLFSQIGVNRDRDKIKINEFSSIFDKNSKEWYVNLKQKNLVDMFVPFLPLAESHVRKCILKDFIHKGRDPSERLIEAVMDELSFFDMGGSYGQMSLTGCKRVHDKVDLHIDD